MQIRYSLEILPGRYVLPQRFQHPIHSALKAHEYSAQSHFIKLREDRSPHIVCAAFHSKPCSSFCQTGSYRSRPGVTVPHRYPEEVCVNKPYLPALSQAAPNVVYLLKHCRRALRKPRLPVMRVYRTEVTSRVASFTRFKTDYPVYFE